MQQRITLLRMQRAYLVIDALYNEIDSLVSIGLIYEARTLQRRVVKLKSKLVTLQSEL